ncbi:MAG: hypothetical protein CVU05_06815 [Bacteroidetes bacterium HGW-Bacteroidetes-21]|jgi:hypothetical protein|nr:MAG: hypothetical protein CVU05_06815 [Bacteroidetes bacterium HGW-Bacteroidetes-21]
MNSVDLKKNFHLLIDSIDNENLLIHLYEIIKNRVSTEDGQLWGRLTKYEQEELIQTFEECKSNEYLISNEEMKKKHKKWL